MTQPTGGVGGILPRRLRHATGMSPRRRLSNPTHNKKTTSIPGWGWMLFGGVGGIRTHGTVAGTPDFESKFAI